MAAAAGYLFASKWQIDWPVFAALIFGATLVIASAGVLNNYVDRDLDRKMTRTKKRPLASGQISDLATIVYAAVLGIAGFWILSYTNWLTWGIINAAYFSYIVVYGLAKRYTVHSTLVGTIPGGASLVAGYTAVTNRLDEATLILFLIMLSWQMVHFYAIAIYRLKDYTAAKIPILPAKKGVKATKIYMLVYLIIFIIAVSSLTVIGRTGYIYLVTMVLLGSVWLRKVIEGFSTGNDERWAQGVFKFSLAVLLAMSGMLSVGPILP